MLIFNLSSLKSVTSKYSRGNLSIYSEKYQHAVKRFRSTRQRNFDKWHKVLKKEFFSFSSRPQHHLSATDTLSIHPPFDNRDRRPEMGKSAIIYLCLLPDRLYIRFFFQHLLCMAQFSDRQYSSAMYVCLQYTLSQGIHLAGGV